MENDNVVDLTEDNEAEASAAAQEDEDQDLYGAEIIEDAVRSEENGEENQNPAVVLEEKEEGGETVEAGDPGEDDENPFADDEDSDEEGGGVQVTIRRLEPTEKPAARQGKLDLDATATINDKPIYDLDLAQMEDRPWKKPGADIADYFNYGFTEETWNLYCERQKKLRAEFAGNQQQANAALFAAIKISNPLANPVINNSSSVVKVLTDNGGRFKQPAHHNQPTPSPIQNEQVIRTVISGNPSSAPSLMDFTRPPPGMSMPPPMGMPMPGGPPIGIKSEAPPGIEPSDLPPGIDSTPVSAAAGTTAPPPFGGGLDLNLGLPHMGFNPNLPPPGMPPMGMMSNMPPPGFSMPPPAFGGAQHSRAGFGPGPGPVGGPPRGLPGFGGVSDDDDERRARRKRSRSRSPRRGDRDRDERRDRDSRRRGEERSTRRHRSRSTSGDRRRRRGDEREKRRDREEDSRKKSSRSRREDDTDERREKRSTRTRDGGEEEPTGTTGNEEESPSAE